MTDPSSESYDVVVAGSGLAGCTAAILLARSGLKIALLEAHKDPQSYKRMCTHYIQSSALPTIQRLGLDPVIEKAGGIRNHAAIWTRYGWVNEPEPKGRPNHGYNLRRKVLDPLMRSAAADEPGVTLVLGAKVRDLIRAADGRVSGAIATIDGVERQFSANLVVGADGKNSKVAEGANLPARELPNQRFGYFAGYRDVSVKGDAAGQIWLLDPDVAYAFSNEDNITVLVALPDKARLAEFTEDREAALLRMFEGLTDAPDLSAAERVSDVVGVLDYPSITRKKITAPGVALIGDAAMVADPLWGIGCGWAFQTPEWLADAVMPALKAGDLKAIDTAARRYGRQHKRRLGMHQFLSVDFSSGRPFNPLERLLFSGAVHDPWVANRFFAFGTRNSSPVSLFNPRLLARAWRAGKKVAA